MLGPAAVCNLPSVDVSSWKSYDRDRDCSDHTPCSTLEKKPSQSEPRPHALSGANVPSHQEAIITPEVGTSLNLIITATEVREPDPGEAVDVCFSMGPEPGYRSQNHIAGHEGIGYVVKSHDLSLLGRPVAMRFLAAACESCVYCLRGLQSSCPEQLNIPKHVNGTFQHYNTVPISCLMPLPAGLLDEGRDLGKYCAALCSGSAALRAIRASNCRPGDVALIIGVAGGIGHLIGMMAKRVFGLKVIGIDRKWKIDTLQAEQRAQVADVFLPTPGECVERESNGLYGFKSALLSACTQLRGDSQLSRYAETVIVTASEFSAFQNLEEYACDGGSIVCVGVPRGDCKLSIPLATLVERSLRFEGSLMGGRKEAMEVLQYIRSGLINPIVTEVGLADVPREMQRLGEGGVIGKVAVRLSG